jgi:hypothetical protein
MHELSLSLSASLFSTPLALTWHCPGIWQRVAQSTSSTMPSAGLCALSCCIQHQTCVQRAACSVQTADCTSCEKVRVPWMASSRCDWLRLCWSSTARPFSPHISPPEPQNLFFPATGFHSCRLCMIIVIVGVDGLSGTFPPRDRSCVRRTTTAVNNDDDDDERYHTVDAWKRASTAAGHASRAKPTPWPCTFNQRRALLRSSQPRCRTRSWRELSAALH